MVVSVVGKKKGVSKKSGNSFYQIAICYQAFNFDGLFAETKFVSDSIYNAVTPGKKYNCYTNFNGFIEGVEEVK